MFELYEEMNFVQTSDFEGDVDEIAAALNEFKFYNNLKLLVHDGKIFLESDFRPFSSSSSYVILSNGSGDIEDALNDFDELLNFIDENEDVSISGNHFVNIKQIVDSIYDFFDKGSIILSFVLKSFNNVLWSDIIKVSADGFADRAVIFYMANGEQEHQVESYSTHYTY